MRWQLSRLVLSAMNDTAWTVIGAIAVPIIAFITFWMKLGSRIDDAHSTAAAADKRAQAAEIRAAGVVEKYDAIARDLSRIEVEAFGKIAGLTASTEHIAKSLVAAEVRLAKSVEEVATAMDRLSDTIIKTLADLVARDKRGN